MAKGGSSSHPFNHREDSLRIGPSVQLVENPLQPDPGTPTIQSVPQLASIPSAPRRRLGRKASRRTSSPGARPRTVEHQLARHKGSEYSASERPALTLTASHRAPKDSVVAFATPSR